MSAYLPFHKTKSSLVQIEVSNADILRRIKCFQSSKREEVNRENIVEFCHAAYQNGGQTCARADAVVTKRSDCKSHVKVYRVVNEWGPQLGVPEPGTKVQQELEGSNGAVPVPPAAIDERLFNAEAHLKLNCPVPADVYSRLRSIEERILNLEGISPEYADEMSNILKLVPSHKSRLISYFGGKTQCRFVPPYKADRARLVQGKDVPHIPLNKRRYSKYELRRRLTMLKSNIVGRKLKSAHSQRIKQKEATVKKEIVTKKEAIDKQENE